ncbi:MAG: beta-class carbonic anhydrase [Thermoplasmata archaeon]
MTILTCFDPRVDPAHFLSLPEGEAYICRNTGGRVTDDVLRVLYITQMVGSRRVMVIHHTDCGLGQFTNEELRERIRKEGELDATSVDFQPYTDLDQSVRDDVAQLRKSPRMRRDVAISGHI